MWRCRTRIRVVWSWARRYDVDVPTSRFEDCMYGIVTGFFSNGLNRSLGQVAVANFQNPQGLVDQGGNNYTVGASSGQPIIGQPGDFATGKVRAGSLEQSNVDLSKEFVNMIVTSTGFSAASKVITTSDQLLNELLQTAR